MKENSIKCYLVQRCVTSGSAYLKLQITEDWEYILNGCIQPNKPYFLAWWVAELLSEPIWKHRKPENFISSAVSAEEQNKHDPVSGCSAQYPGLLAWAEKKWASAKFAQVALALPLCLELTRRDFLRANSPHTLGIVEGSMQSLLWLRSRSFSEMSVWITYLLQPVSTYPLCYFYKEADSCLHVYIILAKRKGEIQGLVVDH